MFWLVIAALILIVGLTLGLQLRASEKAGSKRAGVLIMVAALLLAAAAGVVSCVRTVPTGYTGLVTVFGRVEDYTLDSGIHYVAPWKQVVTMDNRIQKRTVSLPCFSSDIQEVSVSYTINYQISKSDAMILYRTVGRDYYETVISPNIAEAVKVVTARYTAEDLVGMRDELAKDIEEILAERLLEHSIEVVGTSIENMDFTDAFTNAVEEKQVAQQNKLRAQTEAERKVIEARAEAEIRKVEADAAAYEVLAKADAEAEANRKIGESLTQQLIDYYYAQNWDGQLPKIVSGESGSTIVNASDLLRTGE